MENGIAENCLSKVRNSVRKVSNPLETGTRMTRAELAGVLVKVSMTEGPAKGQAKVAAAQKR
jgi:hypothetical protein